jgi:[ribosomal protein S5]-alanine N-acetyltransferase
MIVMETQRLLIEDWQADDWQAFRYIARNPEVMRFIGNGKIWKDEWIKRWVNRQIDNRAKLGFAFWKLVEKGNGRLIGHCGMQDLGSTGEIEIGWWLAQDCWGKGLATEAARCVLQYGFEQFHFPRVIAIAHPDNIASLNIMKKLGMKFERLTNGQELGLIVQDVPIALYSIDKDS